MGYAGEYGKAAFGKWPHRIARAGVVTPRRALMLQCDGHGRRGRAERRGDCADYVPNAHGVAASRRMADAIAMEQ